MILENLFQIESQAQSLHIKYQLQNTKKGSMTIYQCFLKMKEFTDVLPAIGIIIIDNDLLLHILDGLGPKYDVIVVNLTSHTGLISLEKAQYLLQGYELSLA